jgi:hypothetical protein
MHAFRIITIVLNVIFLSHAANAIQIPVPQTPSFAWRIAADPNVTTDFAGVNRTELYLDFTHGITNEFEWGLSAHSGAIGKSVFVEQADVSPIMGADLMLRYFGHITEVFHLGLQIDVLYAHRFGISTPANSLGFRLSVPFAMTFESAVAFFLSPGIHFTGQLYADRYTQPSFWGQALGMNIASGFLIYTNGPSILISARPTWGDVRKLTEVTCDFNLGLVFDF